MNSLGKNLGASSIRVPLQFILTGVVSLCVAFAIFIARPDLLANYHYGPQIIGLTHLFIFGWIASVAFGAMYQLVPVALETQLHSEKLAKHQLWMHVIGFGGIAWMFWKWDMKQVGHFGSLLAIGIGLFVYNIARTLKKIPKWNVVAFSIAASLFWISFGAVAGLYVACAKCWSFSPFQPMAQMHAHAHLGVVGFFIQLLLGVSYKLVPMFALSEIQNARRAKWSLLLLNFGLLGAFVGILIQAWWKEIFTVMAVAGLAIYAVEMRAILRARKRKTLDWGLKMFLTALILLVPASLLALVLSWPKLPLNPFTMRLENLYGFVAIGGVLTLALIGMLYKIVPFLIWFGAYSKEVGRSKVPMLADLYSPVLQAFGYWTYLAGFMGVCSGILLANADFVRWSCVILAVSFGSLALNVAKILAHYFHPRIEPLSMRPAIGGAL